MSIYNTYTSKITVPWAGIGNYGNGNSTSIKGSEKGSSSVDNYSNNTCILLIVLILY